MSLKMKSQLIKTPEIRYQPLSRSIAAFLSLPLRFKITIPYLAVAILLAGLATWVITQSFVTRLQERFNVQLVDGFETASTEVFQSESKALITERAIARTIGVAEGGSSPRHRQPQCADPPLGGQRAHASGACAGCFRHTHLWAAPDPGRKCAG